MTDARRTGNDPRDRSTGVALVWPGKPERPRNTAPLPITIRVSERWPAFRSGEDFPSAIAIAGDATETMAAIGAGALLLPMGVGRPRLIYIDPPFNTGSVFMAELPVGERTPGQAVLSLPAYRDSWDDGLAGYLTVLAAMLTAAHAALADDGWLCVHCDQRASPYLRLIADEIFGAAAFRNEIVWSYGLGNQAARRGFPRKHDTLLLYARSDAAPFYPIRGAITPAMANKYRHVRPDGTRYMRSYGREYDLRGGKPVGSVWEIPSVAPTAAERHGYPTQKPLALLDRLIRATTAPGDLVLDPCMGSGTTVVAAQAAGRAGVGIDRSPLAQSVVRARLATTGGAFTIAVAEHEDRLLAARPTGLDEGGHPDGPPRTLRPTATIRRPAPHPAAAAMSVALTGLDVTASGADAGRFRIQEGALIGPGGAPLTRSWSDWLEGWAVAPAPAAAPDGAFHPRAWAFREGRARTLATSLALPHPIGDYVIVRLFDRFGACWDAALPVAGD